VLDNHFDGHQAAKTTYVLWYDLVESYHVGRRVQCRECLLVQGIFARDHKNDSFLLIKMKLHRAEKSSLGTDLPCGALDVACRR